MAQWIKILLHKQHDLSLNPKSCKANVAGHGYDPSIPPVGHESKTGQSPEACGAATVWYKSKKQRDPVSSKVESEDHHTQAMHAPAHTQAPALSNTVPIF